MGGANLMQQFLRQGLVDKMNVHLAPIILGNGIRLFDEIGFLEFEQKIGGWIECRNAYFVFA